MFSDLFTVHFNDQVCCAIGDIGQLFEAGLTVDVAKTSDEFLDLIQITDEVPDNGQQV